MDQGWDPAAGSVSGLMVIGIVITWCTKRSGNYLAILLSKLYTDFEYINYVSDGIALSLCSRLFVERIQCNCQYIADTYIHSLVAVIFDIFGLHFFFRLILA